MRPLVFEHRTQETTKGAPADPEAESLGVFSVSQDVLDSERVPDASNDWHSPC